MGRIRYQLKSGVGQENVERLHREAVKLVEEVGIDVPHKKTLELLAEHEGVKIKGTRVHFDSPLVDRCTIRRPYVPPEDDELSVSAGVYCLNILDMDSKSVRPSTAADLVQMVKLADALGMAGETPLDPQDIPQGLREVAMCKICWENSRSIQGGYIFSPEAAEYIYEMAQVLDKPFGLGGTVIISPMKLDPSRMDLFLRFRNRGVNVGFSSMPLLGVTAPIFYADAYVQAMAEKLAAGTVTTLIFGGEGTTGGATVYPFDMKFGTVVYGSSERLLSMLFGMEVSRYYGHEGSTDSLLTSAKEPDSQAAAEKMATTILCAAFGARSFAYAGTLSLDDIFSPEQLVIDREIVDYVQHFIRGFDLDTNRSYGRLIKEGTSEGDFLAHPSTVENFRKVYLFPELFGHSVFAQWQREGGKDIRAQATETAREKIAGHHFELDPDKQKEIDKIYERAVCDLGRQH
ncbi:MAG: trimethylamine methyltransferase family protein [Planctomycetia bacterium]|nr:trimethylamine methyltransferase family protein [Planctomycetia bacterium]